MSRMKGTRRNLGELLSGREASVVSRVVV
jgi:hypothetical protein